MMKPTHCDTVRESILLEEDLSAAAGTGEVARHLADCQPCRDYRRHMHALSLALREPPLLTVPDGLEDRVMSAVAQNRRQALKLPSPLPRRRLAAVAAAVALLAITVPALLHGRQSQPADPARDVAQTSPAEASATGQSEPVSAEASHLSMPSTGPLVADGGSERQGVADTAVQHSASEPLAAVGATEPAVSENDTAMELAMGIPGDFSSQSESDVYYDPLADWVGF